MIRDLHSAERPPLRIFTWHIHGTYLYYLSKCPCNIYIPVNETRSEGYYGRGSTFPFGENVIEIPASDVASMEFDIILFQSSRNFLMDQFEILSESQRTLPRIYLEHNAPEPHPVNSTHVMNDPGVFLVHVTHYNQMMWTNTTPRVQVIEHGIPGSAVPYSGKIARGIVICNHLFQRGRIVGADIFRELSRELPLDLIGMGSREYGGLGEIKHPDLPRFISRYRFLFNPIRHTSLGLAVLEAMMQGLPVVSLATTEYVTVIRDGENGYCNTNLARLVDGMNKLLTDAGHAAEIGRRGRQSVQDRFSIDRFTADWMNLFYSIIHHVKETSYEKDYVY